MLYILDYNVCVNKLLKILLVIIKQKTFFVNIWRMFYTKNIRISLLKKINKYIFSITPSFFYIF